MTSLLRSWDNPVNSQSVIDWDNPITFRMSFMHFGDNLNQPQWVGNGKCVYDTRTGMTHGYGRNGPGITGTTASSILSSSSSTFTLNTAAGGTGTVACFVRAGFSPTDGVDHVVGYFSNPGVSIFCMTVQKYLDNNIYPGWFNNGTDTRATVAASSCFSQNDEFVAILTWVVGTSSTFYTKGIQRSSVGAPSIGAYTGGVAMNAAFSSSDSWGRDGNSCIFWMGAWDRALSLPEIQYLSNEPWCFLKSVPDMAVTTIGIATLPGVGNLSANVNLIESVTSNPFAGAGGLSVGNPPQATSARLFFPMISSFDHITPIPGLTPSVNINKNGAAFAPPIGAVSEIGSGWYKVAGDTADFNTLGDVLLDATALQEDPTDIVATQVTAYDPTQLLQTNVTRINGAVTGESPSTPGICWGTVGVGSTTTSIVVSALNNPSSLTTYNQLANRVLIFLGNSTTAALRSNATKIRQSATGTTPILIVDTLAGTPANGDTFAIL